MNNNPHAVKGEAHYCARLSEKIVRSLRKRHKKGNVSYRQLSRELGVSDTVVRDAIVGNSWKHVTP